MQAWLPLSETILSMVIEVLPDPIAAQQARIPHLFAKHPTDIEIVCILANNFSMLTFHCRLISKIRLKTNCYYAPKMAKLLFL